MKRKTLFRLKKMTALLCAVVMCVMTLQPIAFAAIEKTTNIGAKLSVTSGDIKFYDDYGNEITPENIEECFGTNYNVGFNDDGAIVFTGVDYDESEEEYKEVKLANRTIVFYAKTSDTEQLVVEGGATVTENDGANEDVPVQKAQWKISKTFANFPRSAYNWKASTMPLPTKQVTVTFSSADCNFRIVNDDGSLTSAVTTYTVDENSSLSFKVVAKNPTDNSKQYTVTVDGDIITAVDGIYTIPEVKNGMVVEVFAELKKLSVTAPATSDAYFYQGVKSVNYGSAFTFSVTPASGYEKPTVEYKQEGDEAYTKLYSANDQYLIEDVTADITIKVTPGSKNAFDVTLPEPAAGFTCYAVSTSTTVSKGQSFIFNVIPAPGYDKPTVSYTSNGKTTTLQPVDGNQYVISNIQGDVQISVTAGDSTTYSVHLPTGTGYTAVLDGNDNSFGYGSSATIIVTNKPGYQIVTVKANGKTVRANADGKYVITNITADVDVEVTVEKAQIIINYPDVADTDPYTLTKGLDSAEFGSSYTFQVAPKAGYQAPVVRYNGEVVTPNGNQYTIVIKTAAVDITIEAGGKISYNVNLPTGTGFTARFENGEEHASIKYQENATFTVTVDPGYVINSVKATSNGTVTTLTGTANGNVYTYTYTVTGNADVSVTVSKQSYDVTLKAADNKNGSAYTINEETVKVAYGDNYTFTVTQGTGYSAPVVKVGETRIYPVSGSEYRVPITANTEITVEAGTPNEYSVTLPTGDGFTAEFDAASGTAMNAPYGSKVDLTVKVSTGYTLNSVKAVVGGKATVISLKDGKYSFDVTGDTTIQVEVTKNTYAVTYNADTNTAAAYTFVPGAASVAHGELCTFKVVANEGYNAPIVTIGENAITPIDGVYSVTIENATTISIVGGEKIKFNVELITNDGVDFENSNLTVEYGAPYTINLKVKEFYDVASLRVFVDGTEVNVTKSDDGTCVAVINEVKANKTVSVEIAKKTFKVTFANEDGYTISTSEPSMIVTAGEEFDFTVTIAESHAPIDGKFAVLASGLEVREENGNYTVTVTANTTISVVGLELKTFNVIADYSNAKVDVAETAAYGSTYEFSVTPNTGYRISSVTVNGTTYEAVNGKYVVYNVTSDLDIRVETVANLLTVYYVSELENHTHNFSKEFTYDQIIDGEEGPLKPVDGCTIHKFSKWTADGYDEISVDTLKSLIATATANAEITLTAQFDTDMSEIENILKLTPSTRETTVKADGKATIMIKAKLSISDKYFNDPCLALSDVEITFGAMVCNTNVDPNTREVKDAIIEGRDKFYNGDSDNKVIVFTYDKTLSMTEADDHNIYMNVNTTESVAATILKTANFVKYTVNDVIVVVIG